jgi:hypothetical protein
MHLRDTGKRIDQLLGDKKVALDDTTRAHLEENKEQITRLLGASLQAVAP